MSFVPLFFQNGADPPDKDELKEKAKTAAIDALNKGADWVASSRSTLGNFVKGMGFYLTATSYISTNNIGFHMGIVCTYRFVHKNKVVSDFKVWQVSRIWPDANRDWFELREIDLVADRLQQQIEKMKEELRTQMKKDCAKHENN